MNRVLFFQEKHSRSPLIPGHFPGRDLRKHFFLLSILASFLFFLTPSFHCLYAEFTGDSASDEVLSADDSSDSIVLPSENKEKSPSRAALALKQAAGENKSSNVPYRWIPNQKILCGSPPTVLHLNQVVNRLYNDGVFQEGDPSERGEFQIEIVGNPHPEVVAPEVDGKKLVLNWGEENAGKSDIVVKVTGYGGESAFLTFQAEAWKPDYLGMLTIVLGGLGLFLFGMKMMSDGLQNVAGNSLRRMIALFTNNRFLAVGVGVLTTSIIQASAVTTVMVIGFINSQIMTLAQGIGVIMGANIGTTTTGWLLALRIGDYGLPMVGIAAFFYLFCKKDRIRFLAMVFLGLGLIFFGLNTMEKGLASMTEIPAFALFMKSFAANSLWGVLKCVMAGAVLTVLVQSSSATIGVTIALASLGAIEFSSAAALVLGENIGTTVTAFLASIGTNAGARRAAYFHILFNVLGVAWAVLMFFPFLLPTVTRIVHVSDGKNVAAGIALTHTLFNTINVIVFLPFVRFFANLLTKYVKEGAKDDSQRPLLTNLTFRSLETPPIAVERARIEILRMGNACEKLIGDLTEIEAGGYSDQEKIQKSFDMESYLDNVQDEVIAFLSKMIANNVSSEVGFEIRLQIRMAEELETISDYLIGILKSNLKLMDAALALPTEAQESFAALRKRSLEMLVEVQQVYSERRNPRKFFETVNKERQNFINEVRKIRSEFQERMFREPIDPAVVVAVNYQLNAWRRICEHIQNIAEAMTVCVNPIVAAR